jgi:signal peptidase I
VTSPSSPGSPEDTPGPLPSLPPGGGEGAPSGSVPPDGVPGTSDASGSGTGAPPSLDPERDEALQALRRGARKRGDKKAAGRAFWKELPILIVVALVVAVLIKTFLVQAFFIPSGSMHDTLLEGDRVMVNKLAYRFGDPARGDVIVFDNPQQANDDGETIFGALVRHVAESLGLSSPDSALIKRVIAVGGETIEIRGNQVYIDGTAIDEPYVKEGSRMPHYGPFTVPEGQVFVMGDNRSQSTDSRVFGPISEDAIIGRAFVRVWPPSRWGGL